MMRRRFYRHDGTVERHNVSLPAPIVWEVRYFPECNLRLLSAPMPSGIIRTFERHDYGYAPDFIGPHRDSDYHALGDS